MEVRSSNQYEKDDVNRFRLNFVAFFIEAATQNYKRHYFESVNVGSLKAVSPKVVFDKEISSLVNLSQIYDYIATDIQAINTVEAAK
ncbi:hypothetical protein Hamer_G010398 [Homarus americanus]|uniref:Uncharacterized protein n=1 Tax=Homarus americanus TaxID=6706 RepID=A0A8J5K3A1_HOMAM|nr:hypothetical protein Hamer_G010398 [Homarus americanus]